MHGRKYRNAARTCDVLFANSAFTARRRARATLGVPAERVVVAHPAPAPRSAPTGERAELGAPYVLTVATLEPRKNLETLVDAHAAARRTSSLLAVVGGAGWGAAAAARRPGVIRLGYVDDDELRASTAARPCSSIRRASRASGFRCSRRWRAATWPRRSRRKRPRSSWTPCPRRSPASPPPTHPATHRVTGRQGGLDARVPPPADHRRLRRRRVRLRPRAHRQCCCRAAPALQALVPRRDARHAERARRRAAP